MQCRNCGRDNPEGARFCDRCGEPLAAPDQKEKAKKNRRTGMILGLAGAGAAVLLAAAVFILRPGREGPEEISASVPKAVEETPEPSQKPREPETEETGTPAPSPEAEAGAEPTPTVTLKETPKATAPPEESPVPETAETPVSPEELEAVIQEIRELYYGIQENLDGLSAESLGEGLTAYRDASGRIRKISAEKGAYGGSLSETYGAEYYYEIDPGTGKIRPRFVFVFGAGEEYRIYLTGDGRCIRYISPDGTVTDYSVPEADLEQVTEVYPFCGYAREISG